MNRNTAGKLPNQLRLVAALASGLLLVGNGCQVAKQTAKLPMRAVSAVVPPTKSDAFDPALIQVELQRFADEYASRTIVAIDAYAESVKSPEAHTQALRWKVSASSAALGIASGPNPFANLLDFLALSTVMRTALEEIWIKSTNGPAFQPWLDASRSLETNAWELANGILTPDQQREMRLAIRRWWEENPSARTGFFARPEAFSSLIRQTGESTDRPGSVFALVGLDPTAGLDPAVREVTRTRLFAERAMFLAQRMPFLVRWQIELMSDQLLLSAPAVSALGSAERLSRATESVSQTAAELPDRITAERKAILTALEAQEGKLRELSAEVTRTLSAGEQMSTSLNTTLVTFDALMKRFGVGEPNQSSPDTNAPPFNILDYAQTAERIATMAQQLDAVIKDAGTTLDSPALDKRIHDLNDLAAGARADVKSVLNHAFLLAAGLIGLALVAAMIYRRTGRTSAARRQDSSPDSPIS